MRTTERFSSRRNRAAKLCILVGATWLLVAPGGALAQPSDCTDPSLCGKVSPLVPMQSAEAVHMGLVWKKGSQNPKILFHGRFPEYTPNDVADPALIETCGTRRTGRTRSTR